MSQVQVGQQRLLEVQKLQERQRLIQLQDLKLVEQQHLLQAELLRLLSIPQKLQTQRSQQII